MKRDFHATWAETAKAADIAAGLHFHDLRGTAVTMFAEAGCPVPEIATITGERSAIAKPEDHRPTRGWKPKRKPEPDPSARPRLNP